MRRAFLEVKRSQLILNQQAYSSGYFLQHKLKSNFLEYYEAFVKSDRKFGNRQLENSFRAFKSFIGKESIATKDINEKLCRKFHDYLFCQNIMVKHLPDISCDLNVY